MMLGAMGHSRRSMPPFAAGSILFMGPSFLINEDNGQLFWNDTDNRFGVGLNAGLTAKVHILEGTVDILTARSGANEHFAVGQTEVTINENGLSTLSFRVEGDTDTSLIRTFPAVNAVAIGPGPEAKLSVQGTTGTQITLSARAAAGQTASIFEAANNSGTRTFASLTTLLACNPDQSATIDFRVSGDTLLNLLFVRASTDRVGIGTNVPSGFFSVGATSQFQVGSDGDLDRIKDVPYSWPAANAAGYLRNDAAGVLSWDATGAGIDHGGLGGLGDDDHLQYFRLAGRAGGQIGKGGTGVADTLDLRASDAADYTGTVHIGKGAGAYGAVDPIALTIWGDGLSYGAVANLNAVRMSSTMIQTANAAFGLPFINLFRDISVHEGVDGTITAYNINNSFSAAPIIRNPTSAAVASGGFVGLICNPDLQNTGAGSMTLSPIAGLQVQLRRGAGTVAVTEYRGVNVIAPTGPGTVNITDFIGIDLAAITASGLNISLRSAGSAAELRHEGPGVFGNNVPATPSVSLEASFNGTPMAFLTKPMTTAQRDTMTPTNGMVIYNSSLPDHQVYRNGVWVNLPWDAYAPTNSFTVQTGRFVDHVSRLILASAERATLEGDARVVIHD